jgi:predicted O-linked N-acetylglucosamine transferase (SPINDLY family)
MRLLALADVSLDSFPFSGGNTTYQALAMGTPVVTLPGDYLRGRLSLAILCELGLTDCIAMDGEDYARVAVRLATDRGWADDVARRIEEGAADIFDDPVFLGEAAEFLLTAAPPA